MKPSRPMLQDRVRFHCASLSLTVACLLSLSDPGLALADEEEDWLESEVEVGFIHQFKTDLDDDGDFEATGGFGRLQLGIPMSDTVRIRTIGTYHGVDYRFGDPPTIRGSKIKPWNTVHVGRLNPLIEFRVNEQWKVFGGPIFEASIENGADIGKGFKPGGLLGAEVTLSSTLAIGFGVLGVAEIESNPYFQPLLLLDWKPLDRLTVHVESWTTRGGEVEIAYRLIDQIEVAYSVRYRRERFSLKEHVVNAGPPAVFRLGSRNEIGEDRAIISALQISYLPQSTVVNDLVGQIRVDLEIGVAYAGRLRIESNNGDLIQSTSYDPAPSLTLMVTVPL